ncbi:MAG: VCBS repeat-containing protein [Cypionkella sp.]|nr:VCBS repeat-containing protein [Cypionkella sp.]
MRRLVAALMLMASAAGAKTVCDGPLCYTDTGGPTGYDHAILGDLPEWRALTYQGRSFAFADGFFEDTAPRMVDVTGDGAPEAIVVHTRPNLGARLVVLSLPDLREIAATPHIGRHHRWLAVAGVGDFDGDGRVEIAYVDRPHLARELVFVRVQGGRLREIDRQTGLTNHRIGDEIIRSVARPCGGDLLLMSADWQRMMAAKIGAPAVDLGPFAPEAWASAQNCR